MSKNDNIDMNSMGDNVDQTPNVNEITKDENTTGTPATKETITDITKEEKKEATEATVNDEQFEKGDKVIPQSDVQPQPDTNQKKKRKFTVFTVIRIICAIGFIVFTYLFINEMFIEPYRADKAANLTRDLYNKPSVIPTAVPSQAPAVTTAPAQEIEATPTPDPNRDEMGRLLSFKDLLEENDDTKGWITIPDTNIDYVVLQDIDDPEYYLTRDFNKEKQKAGSLFLDYKSSVEKDTQNLVIHGHNMTSTDNMFHYLLEYKELDWYKVRPVFDFNTIYDNSKWKIFAVFITNGSSAKEPLFDYTKSSFKNSSDFLNFIYQIRIRSLFNMDTVDVNEDDQIVTLSTCSYEVKNYRTVIVARKVREGEDPTVDVDSVTINPAPLYPGTWYYRYGGKAPKLSDTFEEALENKEIGWYTKPTE